MNESSDPAELVGRAADERLLEGGAANLPAAVGHPDALPPPSPARARLVGIGATLTGVTLILGIVLLIAGVVEVVASSVGLGIAAIAVGTVLLGTHWGWVHVAEATADSIDRRRNATVTDRRQLWLEAIEPYTRYEVATSVDEDGSIHITRMRYRAEPSGDRGFSFVREIELEELHSADEPGAAVAERAELLRRQAAADTRREQELFEVARDSYETALMTRDDAAARQAARRAASEALSDQINANLRDPPLVE